jgi:hypothetical protein
MNVCENHALPSSKAPFASVVFPKGGKKKKIIASNHAGLGL